MENENQQAQATVGEQSTDFFAAMQQQKVADPDYALTENGAVAYATTNHPLLDLHYATSSLRHAEPEAIINLFMPAYFAAPRYTLQWLFMARDARRGMGERRLFRIILEHLATSRPAIVRVLLEFVAEYGRFDDLLVLLDTPVADQVMTILARQFKQDLTAMKAGKSRCSLVAKWLPSITASCPETREHAKRIARHLHMAYGDYRRKLSRLRTYIRVVEQQMSANRWAEIDYPGVPSLAMLRSRKAFQRHDNERFQKFLTAVENKETHINAGTLYPHDIVTQYVNHGFRQDIVPELEALWTALPAPTVSRNTLVVRDGSGSMLNMDMKPVPLYVATALAVFYAEHLTGPLANKFVTFSSTPELVNLSELNTLRDKLDCVFRYNDYTNTNIQAVFELILNTATSNQMTQQDMPGTVLIISDMEFDPHDCTWDESLFTAIGKQYASAGYQLPRLVFWNICSRSLSIPVQNNELGLVLLSGFSPNILRLLNSDSLDPYVALIDMLNEPRYAAIGQVLAPIIGSTGTNAQSPSA